MFVIVLVHNQQSCSDVKNYEAVFAIVEGLESREVQGATIAWQVYHIIIIML